MSSRQLEMQKKFQFRRSSREDRGPRKREDGFRDSDSRSAPSPAQRRSGSSQAASTSSGSGRSWRVARDKRELVEIVDGFYNAMEEAKKREMAVKEDNVNEVGDDDSSTGSSSMGSAHGFGSQTYQSYRHQVEQQGDADAHVDINMISSVIPEMFSRLSKVPVPPKQSQNWGKEVNSVVRAFCKLDRRWLTPQEYASASRFVTRASSERQLTLSSESASYLYNFLLDYIESKGRICDDSFRVSWPSNQHMEQQSVMHELIRAFAQLLVECGQQFKDQTMNILKLLLPFCNHRCIDVDCRFAAIDAVGNFFKSLHDVTALVSPTKLSTRIGSGACPAFAKNFNVQDKTAVLEKNHDVPRNKDSCSDGDTLVECMVVMMGNLHACTVGPAGVLSNFDWFSNGNVDRILISVLRTLTSLFSYLITLPHYDCNRQMTEKHVSEILSDVFQVLRKSFGIIQELDILQSYSKLKVIEPSNVESGEGIRDNAIKFLHQSLQLIGTLFLFQKPALLKSQWSNMLVIPGESTKNNRNDRLDNISILTYVDITAPCDIPRDRFKSIAIYAIFCVLDSIRRHCLELLSNLSNRSAADEITELFNYSAAIRSTLDHLIPVIEVENNLNCFRECLKVLLCGLSHYAYLCVGVAQRKTELEPIIPEISSLQSSYLAVEKTALKLICFRSVELRSQRLECWSDSKASECVPHGMLSSGNDSDGDVKIYRTTESVHCAMEALRYIELACSVYADFPLHGSSLFRPVFGSKNIALLDGCFQFWKLEPLAAKDSEPNTNINNRSRNWRTRNQQDTFVLVSNKRKTFAASGSYFAVLLDRYTNAFPRQRLELGTTDASNDSGSDIQEKLESAQHRAVLAICNLDPSLMIQDKFKVEQFLKWGFQSIRNSTRLLCVKMVGELLGFISYSSYGSSNFVDDSVNTWAIDLVQNIIVSCNDIDHQVRIGAIKCLGTCYKSIFNVKNSIQDQNEGKVAQLRVMAATTLLKSCQDPIGTVRTECTRVLGDVIAEGAWDPDTEPPCRGAEETLTAKAFTILRTLMGDSKLAVRMQAVWALGNIVRDLLPYRLLIQKIASQCQFQNEPQYGLHPRLGSQVFSVPSGGELEKWHQVCNDISWTESIRLTLSTIETDSEKMLPASVQMLAHLTCGIGNSYNNVSVDATVIGILNEITTCFLQLIFGRADTIPTTHVTVAVAQQQIRLYPWQSKQWNCELVLKEIKTNRSHHLQKLLFSMCQLAGALVWLIASFRGACVRDEDSAEKVLSNACRTGLNFLLIMMQQKEWEKISLTATRALTLACSSYDCGIIWDRHYCSDNLHHLSQRPTLGTNTTTFMMAHFLKEFEIPVYIRCLEATMLCLNGDSDSWSESALSGGGSVPVYTYWKQCHSLSDSMQTKSSRDLILQPQGRVAFLLLLLSNLRLLRSILSSCKEHWLVVSSKSGKNQVYNNDILVSEEVAMDVVTSEYERVTSILFHSLPGFLRRVSSIHAINHETGKDYCVSDEYRHFQHNSDHIIYLDDYFQHMALLDINLKVGSLHRPERGGKYSIRGNPRLEQYYGNGSQTTTKRQIICDILDLVLDFFSLTGQVDLLTGTKITVTKGNVFYKDPSLEALSAPVETVSMYTAAKMLLQQFGNNYIRPSLAGCTCSKSLASVGNAISSNGPESGSDRMTVLDDQTSDEDEI